MFLDESYGYNNLAGITADVTCGMQIMNESEEAWHKLEMAMIKLEHQAIINEDAALLAEGVGDFFSTVGDFFKAFGEKFMEFVRKVIIKWEELQMKIQSKFLSRNLTIKNKGIKISADTTAVVGIATSLVKNKPSKEFEKVKLSDAGVKNDLLKIKEFTADFENEINNANKKSDGTTEISSSNLSYYIKFLKITRPQAIKELKTCRKIGIKLYKEAIREAKSAGSDGKADKDKIYDYKETIAKFKKLVNMFISVINHASVLVLKAIKAATSSSKTYAGGYNTRISKSDKRYNKVNPNATQMGIGGMADLSNSTNNTLSLPPGQESAGILSMFMND